MLIEGGFLTNPQDRLRIATPLYRQLIAQSILQGVLSYNRALSRAGTSDKMMVKRTGSLEAGSADAGISIWDPMKPNAYTLPEDGRK